MLKVAVPNKGSLSDTASDILREAGYASRRDSKALIYVANGHLDLGITGRDLAADSLANVTEVLALGFGSSTFRYAAPTGWTIDQLNGARIATSYPNLVRTDLKKRGITADVIRLDGAVEISIKLGVADVIADVVSTGTTLRKQGLEPFGEPLCTSEAVIVGRADREVTPEQRVLLRRVEGILHAQNYLMLDYNVPRHLLDDATRITPGISGPTVALDEWVAVRAMVPRKDANWIMDQLAALGAQAILASEIRIARI